MIIVKYQIKIVRELFHEYFSNFIEKNKSITDYWKLRYDKNRENERFYLIQKQNLAEVKNLIDQSVKLYNSARYNLYGDYTDMNVNKSKTQQRIITNIFIPNCKLECSSSCNNSNCDDDNGKCINCQDDHYYGDFCNISVSQNLKNCTRARQNGESCIECKEKKF